MRSSCLAVLLLLAAARANPNGPREIANTLATRRVSVQFDGASLKELVDFVRITSGLNIVVMKARIEKEIGDPDAIELSVDLHNVTLKDLFELTLEPLGLATMIQGNVLLITTKRESRGKPVLVLYDVAEHLIPIRDFPGQDMNLYGSGHERPEPPEEVVAQAIASSEELAEMVRQFCGRGTWEDEGISLSPYRRHLFIRQYPEVHREIARFLAAVGGLR